MNTYQANILLLKNIGKGSILVVTQINALSGIAAKMILEKQYGRGNVFGITMLS